MIRFLGFYKRKPGLTHEQFNDHWLNIHGPCVRNVPGGDQYLKKYIQHRLTIDPLSQEQDFVYDGFSEGWFESLEARDAFITLPGLKEVIEDEERFLDLTATRWMVMDEHALQIDRVSEFPHPPLRGPGL